MVIIMQPSPHYALHPVCPSVCLTLSLTYNAQTPSSGFVYDISKAPHTERVSARRRASSNLHTSNERCQFKLHRLLDF